MESARADNVFASRSPAVVRGACAWRGTRHLKTYFLIPLRACYAPPSCVAKIVMAVLVFNDEVTWLKMLGLALAMLGTVVYKMTRDKPTARFAEGERNKPRNT